jgi:ubiquitin carboxyl-terminal hydrolase 7
MIEPLKAKQSLKGAELQDGDIVCFQRIADRKEKKVGLAERVEEGYVFLTQPPSPRSLSPLDAC